MVLSGFALGKYSENAANVGKAQIIISKGMKKVFICCLEVSFNNHIEQDYSVLLNIILI